VPANKAVLSRIHDAADWNVVRPPLVSLAADATAQLFSALDTLGFEMERTASA
jgi:hypothetical protein